MIFKKIMIAGIVFLLSASSIAGCSKSGQSRKDQNISDTQIQNSEIPNRMDSEAVVRNTETETGDKTLDTQLAKYRADREPMSAIPMGNGVTGAKMPNPRDYGIDDSYLKTVPDFDARELNEAFEVADKYVKDTLKIKITTKSTLYTCVDPRIYQIYTDNDKGIAAGYENSNIFFCEYKADTAWQYLFLVRDGKGKPWKVIYHGSTYKK